MNRRKPELIKQDIKIPSTLVRYESLTPQQITDILKDKYHNGKTVAEVTEEHSISYGTWNKINKAHGEKYVEKFGNKVATSKQEALDNYWSTI